MRVYISVDMEGIGGIVDSEQTMPEGLDYQWSRGLMVAEVNAAIAGALSAGATEVVVNDAHNTMRNLKPQDLHVDARLVTGGRAKPLSMMAGLGPGYSAVIFIGYHTRVGEPRGVLGHSFYPSSTITRLAVNGLVVGETALNGYLAGHFGVPVVMVAGDSAVCREAESVFPQCLTVATKEGLSKYSALGLHPAACRALIEKAAREAVAGAARHVPVRAALPVKFEVTLASPAMADMVCLIPTVERRDEHTVAWAMEDYLRAYQLFTATGALARAASDRVYG